MKRYIVFSGDTYYPAGGWDDYRGEFDSAASAFDYAESLNDSWWQVIDTVIKQEVVRKDV